MVSDQGFSGGRSAMIGPGQAPNGQPMASAELCCGSCAAHPQCVKFTFRFQPWSPGIGECILYRDIAEAFIRTGEYLTAGTVLARDIAQVFIEPPFPPQANDAPRPSPPPVPPVFPIMAKLRHEDTSTPQGQDADALDTGAMVSLGGAGLVILLVMRWAFCGSDSGRQAKFARVDKHGKRPGRARMERLTMAPAYDDDEDDDDDDDDDDDNSRMCPSARKQQAPRSARAAKMLPLRADAESGRAASEASSRGSRNPGSSAGSRRSDAPKPRQSNGNGKADLPHSGRTAQAWGIAPTERPRM